MPVCHLCKFVQPVASLEIDAYRRHDSASRVFAQAQEGGPLPLYGQLLGASVICAVPVVLLYMFFQRYLVGGLASGGVKG